VFGLSRERATSYSFPFAPTQLQPWPYDPIYWSPDPPDIWGLIVSPEGQTRKIRQPATSSGIETFSSAVSRSVFFCLYPTFPRHKTQHQYTCDNRERF